MLQDKNVGNKGETVKDAVESLKQEEPSVFEEWITEICEKSKKGSKYYRRTSCRHKRCLEINRLSTEYREMEKYFKSTLHANVDEMIVTDTEQM